MIQSSPSQLPTGMVFPWPPFPCRWKTTGTFCPAVVAGTVTKAVLAYPSGSWLQLWSMLSVSSAAADPGLGRVVPVGGATVGPVVVGGCSVVVVVIDTGSSPVVVVVAGSAVVGPS